MPHAPTTRKEELYLSMASHVSIIQNTGYRRRPPQCGLVPGSSTIIIIIVKPFAAHDDEGGEQIEALHALPIAWS